MLESFSLTQGRERDTSSDNWTSCEVEKWYMYDVGGEEDEKERERL